MADQMASHVEEGELAWQKVLRAMQSTWREERGLQPGRGGRDQRVIGSRLTTEDGEAGRNFLTEETWRRVRADLAEEVDGRVMDRGRLLTNLLSSQPLAFNLFAELSVDPGLAGRALQLVLPDLVTSVRRPADGRPDPIRFEWSPGRGDDTWLGNRSAFDVVVEATGPGGDVLLGIEVKYHENLQAKPGTVRERAQEVARSAGLDPDRPEFQKGPLNQVFLDHMLACAVDQVDEQAGHFVFLHPVVNRRCRDAVANYRRLLPPGSPAAATFHAVTMEELVGAVAACTIANWPREFRHRYLDYDRVAHLAVLDR